MKLLSLLASMFGLSLLSALAGCTTTTTTTGGKPLPWWVADPGAPLPKDFPPPGPLGEVVIKQYPAYRSAVTRSSGNTGTNGMFFPLYSHIERNHIAMSAPVEIGYAGAEASTAGSAPSPKSMAFIYGDNTLGAPGADGSVEVVDYSPMTVASIGVAGAYTDRHFAQAYARLDDWLKAHASEYIRDGEPRYLAYNSPFVIFQSKYGEVQVPIKPAAK
jgi:hypothetical protein